MVPGAYDEFFKGSGGYGCLDNQDAIEKLQEAVERFVIGRERERATEG